MARHTHSLVVRCVVGLASIAGALALTMLIPFVREKETYIFFLGFICVVVWRTRTGIAREFLGRAWTKLLLKRTRVRTLVQRRCAGAIVHVHGRFVHDLLAAKPGRSFGSHGAGATTTAGNHVGKYWRRCDCH